MMKELFTITRTDEGRGVTYRIGWALIVLPILAVILAGVLAA